MVSIYQRYAAKGSKKRTSAGTPKSAEGAAEGKVRESASHHFLFKNHCFFDENAVFLVLARFQVDLGSFLKNRQKFNFSSKKKYIFCDTFPVRTDSSRGPIELILSQLKALM